MSLTSENPDPSRRLTLDSGLEALQSSSEFGGPVEGLDGHDCNDHFAQIYEADEERFAAAVPFVRHGLEDGEQVMYVLDESSEAEVREALQGAGIDVEAAVDAGTLSFHTVQETYLRNGTFDPDGMVDFYEETVAAATAEHSALRIVAETTWLQDDAATVDRFMEYEAKINDLFAREDCLAICQYDRDGFPPEVVRNIVQTHPHLIYDGAVCHNFYYTPPEEFLGPDRPSREVDRMLGTLRARTAAKSELAEHKGFLQALQDVTASRDRSFEEKLDALFELGCEHFGLDVGGLNRVDPDDDRFVVERVNGDHSQFEAGRELPLSETYCQVAADARASAAVTDPEAEGLADIQVCAEDGVGGYLGTYVPVEGGDDRTLGFICEGTPAESFSAEDRAHVELMGQWVGYELNRRQRERFVRECYEITADPDLDFEAKLGRLLDLARDSMGLDAAGLSHLPECDGAFLTEYAVGIGGDDGVVDASDRVWTDPGEGRFCRAVVAADAPVGKADVRGTAWEDDEVHREQGLSAYLGTTVRNGSTPYGTLWIGGSEPRDRPFTDTERTFLELMGQWVSYEIERREHGESQRELYRITADPDLATEEKIDRLLAIGRDRLDMPVGMLNRDVGGAVEIQRMRGTHSVLAEGVRSPPDSKYYCRKVIEGGDPVIVDDAADAGWEGDPMCEDVGLEAYAGVPVNVAGAPYGTLCFADDAPRGSEFSDAERAFVDLMGQCVSYELDRAWRERRLHALNMLGRELMDADTPTAVAEATVAPAEHACERPVTAVALYDEETGDLRPAAQSVAGEAFVEATALLDGSNGPAWEAFTAGESRTVTDADAHCDETAPPVTEAVVHPLGTHGVFLTGTVDPHGFRKSDHQAMETAAAHLRAALDRVNRERQIQDREAALEEQNETLARLNRINDTIRRIDQVLVESATREEIERVVCEELAAVGPYEMAWIGVHDAVTDEIAPTETAGVDRGYLGDVEVTAGDGATGNGPAGRAVTTREPQVVNDVLTDPSFEPWAQSALNRGYHSVVALPLEYGNSLYGVLVVYAGQPNVFDDLERSVLAEMADTIAHAVNAVESKKALVSDEVIELDFSVTDSALELVELAAETDCEFTFENIVPRPDGKLRGFGSTRGVPSEDVVAFAPRLPATDVTTIAERDVDGERVCLFEFTLDGGSLVETVLDHGGRVEALEVDRDGANVAVHLAADAEIRQFVETFRREYPESELLAQRRREQPVRTATGFLTALTEEFTARQLEALQTAYFSGYFEQPRTRTASEIAETMGISQPTFNSHLRTALRKLCDQLLENHSVFA